MSSRVANGAALFLITFAVQAASAQQRAKPQPPTPTHAAVSYGTHMRQVLDYYAAESTDPTPVVYIHGGGWLDGTREVNPARLQLLHYRKISVATISYRFTTDAVGLEPPVKAPLLDAARAVQFLRTKAAEWNIDKERIAASGGSAGWLSVSKTSSE